MAYKKINRVDENQPAIVKALKKCGVHVLYTYSLPDAFDILCAFQGKQYIVEIKNDAYLPKKFYSMEKPEQRVYLEGLLTPGERQCMEDFKAKGVDYHIVYNIDSALEVFNLRRMELF